MRLTFSNRLIESAPASFLDMPLISSGSLTFSRALAGNPLIILADEPTGNLDHKSGELVVKTLRELVMINNASAVIVTHDSRIFHSLDRVFYMEDGKIRA